MWHFTPGDWMVMLHGELRVGYNKQYGPRGVGKAESQNWLMVMADRKTGPGLLSLRGMFSAEPIMTPHGGFPQLFQTGETYRGQPIVDAQHAHWLGPQGALNHHVLLEGHAHVVAPAVTRRSPASAMLKMRGPATMT